MLLVATIDPILRHNLQEALTQQRDSFLILEDGEDIVEAVLRHQPSLVILDFLLSHPSGLISLRRLRTIGFSGKVIVLGGPSTQSFVAEATRLGTLQIIGRPFNANQILGAARVAQRALDDNPKPFAHI